MSKLKIGLVIDDTLDTNDGVQQYVLALGAWLTRRGHKVHYLAGETRERNLANLHSLSRNIKVRFNHNRMSIPLPASKSRLKKLLDSENFDILHVQMPYSPFLAGRIIKLAAPRAAVVGTFHILPYSRISNLATRLLVLIEHSSLNKFSKFISVSPAAQRFVGSAINSASEVIPNVVEVDRFAQAQPNFRLKGKLTIVFLGRLVPRKGCQTLLSAIDELVRTGHDLPEFRVVVCGAGPLMPNLIKFVKANRLTNTVKFVGYVGETDKASWLASADISVFPSSGGESFGIVLVEAMSSGKSLVLAGRNPGYQSVLGEQPELLFDPTNSHELAIKLAKFMNDTKARRDLAAWCARRSLDFDVAKVGLAIESIYYQVASARKSSHN